MMEVEAVAFKVLKNIGVRRSQIVVDFGCGHGTYTIPAAKIAGEEGRVYALDKDKKALNELMQKAESAGLENITRMDTSGKIKSELANESVDMVLLFDVFHEYYFPHRDERRKLLGELQRVLKPDGLLSVYPKHIESSVRGEIESANFYLESEYSGTLIHVDKDLEKGKVLNFRKKLPQ